jgi:rhamnose utilization protein RhaD (predicted bifunctional aldolase and dehydrogenase)
MTNAHHDISQFCATLGKDRLLVQGAGGNVSWKEDGVLWVKGSGTWLANADKEDLFVPVNLTDLTHALSLKNFDITPKVIGEQPLRPSIETILHALMPQIIVVHLHAIDALVHLVTRDSQTSIQQRFKEARQPAIHTAFVGYHKPGPELAQAIDHALKRQPNINAIFLKNHGIVIGGNSIQEIESLLQSIMDICRSEKAPKRSPFLKKLPAVARQCAQHYIAFPDVEVQQLALDPTLFKRLQSDWVLFPDHVVFLGPKTFTYSSWGDFIAHVPALVDWRELIFIENTGVFVKPDFSLAKTAQLRCYYDVISRVTPDAYLEPLDDIAIHALLNWDAEKLRQQMANT